jgi:hypothetical protein
MIVSFELLAYCFIAGGVFIFLFDILWNRLEKYLPTLRHFPCELIEPKDLGAFISTFIIEFIFFVLMPAAAYGMFYTSIPFYGIRGGLAVGIYVVLLGIAPYSMLIIFKVKIPALFMLYQLLGVIIKIFGSMAIIGYLYSL